MIKFSNDYCCSICEAYLSTEQEIISEKYPDGRVIRKNAPGNYAYRVYEDDFVCDQCLSD